MAEASEPLGMETWIMSKVYGGAPLPNLCPFNDRTKARWAPWLERPPHRACILLTDGLLHAVSTRRTIGFCREACATGVSILGIMAEAPKLGPAGPFALLRQVVARSAIPDGGCLAPPCGADASSVATEAPRAHVVGDRSCSRAEQD